MATKRGKSKAEIVPADALGDARAEARRRIAARKRAEGRATFKLALIEAERMLPTIFAPVPESHWPTDPAARKAKLAVARRGAELMMERIRGLLEQCSALLPRELDPDRVRRFHAAISEGRELPEAPLGRPVAAQRETARDVTARVLVERGYRRNIAVRAAYGIRADRNGLVNSKERKRQDDREKARKAKAAKARRPLTREEEAEWTEVIRRRDKAAARVTRNLRPG